jgi:hypothetical protein
MRSTSASTNLLVRSSEAGITVPTDTAFAEATNLIEHIQPDERVTFASDHVAFTIQPFEIRTLR